MSKFLQEFRDFAVKGNMIDMAVGIIIGGAFGKIVTSLVSDIIMPPIGLLVGGVNFTEWNVVLKEAVMENGEVITPALTLNYGNFIQVLFDFLIIALSIFFVIRGINKMKEMTSKKKAEEEAAAPAPEPEPTKEEILLTEIRDLLKNK
ncbi:MAG: large-conductance mechanosensitive channel protein MscL [Bacteroidales bacterium]|nr:large-conductance mechanosensitive channel protein MscL [Bacteroidales bacterium]